MRLLDDLYTIYGDLLAKRDEDIIPQAVKKIQAIGDAHQEVRVMMEHTEIFADFERSFNDERYRVMLEGSVSKDEIRKVAGQLMFENDLIFELSNMKKNLPYTYQHVLIVAIFAIKLSLMYKPGMFDQEVTAHCGFTHDLGKTRIPVAILNKEGRLTAEEREIIETHPLSGYLLLNYYLKSDRRDVALASLDHHERLDGSGYPNGKKKMSKYTQLISAVDIMDALMTVRPYRKMAFSLRATLDYLMQQAAMNKLNKDIVLTLISLARKEKPDIRKMKLSTEIREKLPEELTHDKYK